MSWVFLFTYSLLGSLAAFLIICQKGSVSNKTYAEPVDLLYNHKKGFVFTIDATFALLIFAITLLLISHQIFQDPTPRSTYLKQISSDTITVLEKTGKLGQMLGSNSTEVRQVLDSLPQSVCAQVSLMSQSGNTTTITRPGCTNYQKELQIIRSPYIYGGSFYTTEIKSWFE